MVYRGAQICPGCVHWCTEVSRYVQRCVHWCIEVSKHIQRCVHWCIEVSRHVQRCVHWCIGVQTCPEVYPLVYRCLDMSRGVSTGV